MTYVAAMAMMAAVGIAGCSRQTTGGGDITLGAAARRRLAAGGE